MSAEKAKRSLRLVLCPRTVSFLIYIKVLGDGVRSFIILNSREKLKKTESNRAQFPWGAWNENELNMMTLSGKPVQTKIQLCIYEGGGALHPGSMSGAYVRSSHTLTHKREK